MSDEAKTPTDTTDPNELAYVPPDGQAGWRQLKLRRQEALGILQSRGVGAAPRPEMVVLHAIELLVRARLDVGDAEWKYFTELASLHGLEEVVKQTAPKPKIHLLDGKGH